MMKFVSYSLVVIFFTALVAESPRSSAARDVRVVGDFNADDIAMIISELDRIPVPLAYALAEDRLGSDGVKKFEAFCLAADELRRTIDHLYQAIKNHDADSAAYARLAEQLDRHIAHARGLFDAVKRVLPQTERAVALPAPRRAPAWYERLMFWR